MAATSDLDRLTTFQHHIDDMRNLVMCKICLKPLYEPFILACGHTYCYGCLRSWFSGLDSRRRKKNCPDCRAEVDLTPSPNYILRDLVHKFIGRAELLPEDETVDEHTAGKETEAKLLSSDKDGKGIFQGVFKNSLHPHGDIGALHDLVDGVLRCPLCYWELEEGMCNQCGYELEDEDYADLSTGDDEDDGLVDSDGHSIVSDNGSSGSSFNSDYEIPRAFYEARAALNDVNRSIGTDVPSDLDYETPERYGHDDNGDEMEGFIDDQDDDEDEPDEIDEDDMEERRYRHLPRPRGLYRIPDDEDDEDGDASDGDENRTLNHEHHQWPQSFSIEVDGVSSSVGNTESSDNEDDDNEDEDEDQLTNYDESDDESRSATPVPVTTAPSARRRRPIVISDDEDVVEEEEAEEEEEEEDDEDEDRSETESRTEGGSQSEVATAGASSDEDSDDTTIPPQSAASRRRRLDSNRKRRRTQNSTWRAVARDNRNESGDQRGNQLAWRHEHPLNVW